MGQTGTGTPLGRAIARGRVAHWVKRLRVAEGIVWLAGVEAQAVIDFTEWLRCTLF